MRRDPSGPVAVLVTLIFLLVGVFAPWEMKVAVVGGAVIVSVAFAVFVGLDLWGARQYRKRHSR